MQRETVERKQKILLNISSVNERVQGTELADNEWSSITGTFPDFTGEQARIWGKRLLAKYANPILGIYQFWTPLGYAVGLYQFSGSVDFGLWTTTPTRLDLTIPPTTNFDGGNISLDDFSQEFGRTADVSTPNVCEFNFDDFLATHSYCGAKIIGSNLPDDNNGGPAGQGKKCKWQNTLHTYSVSSLATSQLHGGATVNTSAPATNPPFAPNPIPLPPVPTLSYTAGVSLAPFARYVLSSGGIFAPPTQFFTANCENWITTLDFTAQAALFTDKAAFATLQVSRFVNSDPPTISEIPITSIDFTDPASYSNVVIDASQYLPSQVVLHGGTPTGSQSDQGVSITAIKLYVRQKICS